MNAVSLNITEAKHTDSTAATRVLTNMTTDLTSGQLTVQYTDGCVDHWYDAGSSLTAVGLKEDNASMSNPEWLMTTDNTMIYDIEVKVYDKKPSAGGKLLATLTGTKTE
jgi:hypothetical protein